MLRASLLLGLLISTASGSEPSSCNNSSGKCADLAEEASTLLQFQRKVTVTTNLEEDTAMAACDDSLVNHASTKDNLSEGSSTNKTALMEKG